MKQYHLKNGSVIAFAGNCLPKDRIRAIEINGVAGPNMKVKVNAVRTDCCSGQDFNTEITLEKFFYEGNLNEWCVKVAEGGVTGFESFMVKDMNFSTGWYACAGTEGRWDTLFIPAEEMQKLEPIFGVGKNEQR